MLDHLLEEVESVLVIEGLSLRSLLDDHALVDFLGVLLRTL